MKNSSLAFSANEKCHTPIIILAIIIGTSIKLFYALTTVGTNDVVCWATFMDHVVEHGSVDIYKNIWYYNHPPLMSLMLAVFHKLQDYLPNGFPFLIRLPAILADIGSCILVYQLIKTYKDAKSALFATIVVALSPILIFVSGFHGNTDPVFMFLIMLSAYFYLRYERVILPALILGLALNIKIVPIITVPAFFFFTKGWKNKILFCTTLSMVFLSGFIYHAVADFEHLYRNIFQYSGLSGIWGIGQVLSYHFSPEIAKLYNPFGKLLIFFSVTFSMLKLSGIFQNKCLADQNDKSASSNPEKSREFLFALSWTFLLFFVFTPGFGVQYLVWLVIPTVILDLRGALAVNITGGFFLFMVYTFWSGGFPWHYANSDKMGSWQGIPSACALLLWLILFFWVIKILRDKEHLATL